MVVAAVRRDAVAGRPAGTIGPLRKYDRRMCRILAYLGEPLPVRNLLFDPDNSLVAQSYSPRMMNTFLNLAGFGMKAWDPSSLRPEEPFTYRATALPSFDRNLRHLSAKVAPTCLIAHVRGVTFSEDAVVAQTNLHPFHFAGARVVLAHNGHLRQFARMRYALLEHVRPELAERIEGTTDSEWIYALVLSQLEDPSGLPDTRQLADAVAGALSILRDVRAAHEIDTSSPVNLCVSTGNSVVATRFSLDYGWYPPEDEMLETDLPFVSLWYAIGGEYEQRDGEWQMSAGDPPRSVIIASEPLTADISTWFEVPEYSMLTAELTAGGIEFETRDLDA
jgi:glutamine amidotransferase